MTNHDIENLLAQGVFVTPTVSSQMLIDLAKKFAPFKTEFPMVRLGPENDGGYLVPDDLVDISACFSPGVSYSSYFEEDLLNRYKINSHLADYSVDGPPHGFRPHSFTKKFLGAYNDEVHVTLEKWVKDQWHYNLGRDLLLQMDIEGAEYETLLATPDEILKRFRVVIIEIHNLDSWGVPQFYKVADALANKLLQHFVVVHNHVNNWGGSVLVNGIEYPRTIEITLLRKDRAHHIQPAQMPHELDSPCNPRVEEIQLPKHFSHR